MEQNERRKQKKAHPKDSWELPILFKSHTFTENSLYEAAKEHKATALGDKLEFFWKEEEICEKRPSLTRALLKSFGKEYLLQGLILLPFDLGVMLAVPEVDVMSPTRLSFRLLRPYCMKKFLNCFTQQECVGGIEIYLHTSSIVSVNLLQVLYFHWFYLQFSSFGIKVRVACSSLIYRKCLEMKKQSFKKKSVGQVVNLFNDVNRFNDVFVVCHYLWISPLKILIFLYYMDVVLGPTALTGIFIIICFFLVQLVVSKQMFLRKRETALKTDDRIRLINDVIGGIQTVKMYTWETPFSKLVKAARRSEMKILIQANLLSINNHTIGMYVTKIALFLCVLSVILTKVLLTPEYIFPLISMYENLILVGVLGFQLAATFFTEAKTSVARIQEFLLSGRKKAPVKQPSKSTDSCSPKSHQCFEPTVYGIHLNNVKVVFDTSTVLEDVTFSALPGDLVGISGKSGSGKSTLLQVILQEIKAKGTIAVGGKISYASQEAWIFSASIKQNILFGEEEDEKKYRRVIRACALEHDLSLFANGDQTLVGERGVMLSGGQKSRINLARAVYRDADIYLLDDPLAAVDGTVAQHIFNECILGYLKDKCVVLVTHHLKYLRNVKKRYIINKGKVVEEASSENVFMESDEVAMQEDVIKSHNLPPEIHESATTNYSTRQIYKKYWFSGSHWILPYLIFALLLLTHSLNSFIDIFINTFYVYASLIVLLFFLNHTLSVIFTKHCICISKNLHNTLLDKILALPMKFFNEHPSGRILNRFSQDVGRVDETIPFCLYEMVRSAFDSLGTVIIVVILNYWLIIPTLAAIPLIYLSTWLFQPLNRNLRKLEGITKSPILTYVVTSLRGLPTIRAFNKQKLLVEEFESHQDAHSSAFYLFKSLFFTYSFWIDLICCIYSTIITFSFLTFNTDSSVAIVGLAVSQANILVGLVQFVMKMWSELSANMTSVERVLEYIELPQELDNGTFVPPPSWPQVGQIEFKSVSMRYSPDKPLILKNIEIKLHPREKVGIVGRTGAGKSSLVSTLFRLTHFEGQILIDNVDTKVVPLNVLRSKITIIPQDPILFVGSLRKNLDPFEEFSDSQVWSALEAFNLKAFIANLPLGLETLVDEGGTNFSVGQKQLLCLSRAMLKKTKIFVLDEATANVDLQTDEGIQATIREKFKDCTLLVIAHRLDTILDSDKVVVMDDGRVVDFGKPEELFLKKHFV
ncbi:probable multidrug resistance-associated protein lethal(2)03659 [Zophobas morio]|uniref:probable multidrug resistance-associated protein lethal(2)03659 n=1 Tax=Zophobas morio TaxID=2755281 RepID=UPI0030828FFB